MCKKSFLHQEEKVMIDTLSKQAGFLKPRRDQRLTKEKRLMHNNLYPFRREHTHAELKKPLEIRRSE